MNNIESSRSKFFPRSKVENKTPTKSGSINRAQHPFVKNNDLNRQKQIESLTGRDAKVSIPHAVKDYAKIRKAVDMAPEVDNSEKIADLKQRIQAGTYSIDYDALADKMLTTEY